MKESSSRSSNRAVFVMLVGLMAAIGLRIRRAVVFFARGSSTAVGKRRSSATANSSRAATMDTSGFSSVVENLPRWKPDSTLEELSRIWSDVARRDVAEIDERLVKPRGVGQRSIHAADDESHVPQLRGRAASAYELLEQTRLWVAERGCDCRQGSLHADLFPGGDGIAPRRDG